MRRFIRKGFKNFEFFRIHESRTEDKIIEFRDTFSALNFLRQFLTDTSSIIILRSILHEFDENCSLLTDYQVLDRLAWRLVSSQLRVSEWKIMSLHHEAPTWDYMGAENQEASPPLSASTEEEETEKTWIEIELVDEEHQPVVGEKYRITLADGSLKTGKTNSKGLARITGINPGECMISFPDMDRDTWERYSDFMETNGST